MAALQRRLSTISKTYFRSCAILVLMTTNISDSRKSRLFAVARQASNSPTVVGVKKSPIQRPGQAVRPGQNAVGEVSFLSPAMDGQCPAETRADMGAVSGVHSQVSPLRQIQIGAGEVDSPQARPQQPLVAADPVAIVLSRRIEGCELALEW